jgi:hypothetical protein
VEVTNMRSIKSLGAVALALAAAGTARAGNPPPPKEAKDIACLVGSWKGTASMTMGKDKVDGVKLSWTCKPTSGQWGVACNASFVGMPGIDKYEETDLFGYDPGAGKYHWFAVTNGGETHDHVGTQGKGDTIEFVYNGAQEGKPFKEVIQMSFKGKNESMLDFRSEGFLDGKSTFVLTGSANK